MAAEQPRQGSPATTQGVVVIVANQTRKEVDSLSDFHLPGPANPTVTDGP